MDGRNSFGRRISLLNDADEAVSAKLSPRSTAVFTTTCLPYRAPPSPLSRASSYLSTPGHSPKTPLLVRSDSTDSRDSRAMQTPSPLTPSFSFEAVPAPPQSITPFGEASFFVAEPTKESLSAYAPVPQQTGPLLYPTADLGQPSQAAAVQQQQQQGFYQPTSPADAPAKNPKSKKNSYPCPLAKQYSCNDYFTTSGHAARHAKKHTGKKDAHCPECNKAFTRKDNMEQHRRTHQSGRNAKGASTSSEESKAKKSKPSASQAQSQPAAKSTTSSPTTARRPHISPLQSAAPVSFIDASLPLSPTSTVSAYGMTPPLHAAEPFAVAAAAAVAAAPVDFSRPAYPDPTQFAHPHLAASYDMLSPSYALDALAMAASGEKRKFDGIA